MDGDEDDVSFHSISDSDAESDPVKSLCSLLDEEIPRASSPAVSVASLCSLRRRSTPKRMAPQPPCLKIPVSVCIAEPQKLNRTSSFRQEFQKGVEKRAIDIQPHLVKDIGAFASHPIKLLPAMQSETKVEPLSSKESIKVEDPVSIEGPSRDFSRLQSRLIDDVTETITNVVPEPSAVVTTVQNMLYSDPFAPTYSSGDVPVHQWKFPQSSIQLPPHFYTSSVNLSQSPPVVMAQSPLAYHLQNIPQENALSSPTVYLPSLQEMSRASQVIEVRNPLLGLGLHSNELVATSNSNYSIQRNYRLGHSASEPGLIRVMERSAEPVRRGGRRLESLSEEEEEDEDSVFSDETSYEKVGYSESDERGVSRRMPHRVSRSNSNVTVAHLYEDLLVSSRFNLKVTLTNLTVVVVIAALFVPNSSAMIFSIFRLIFGTLFPAYYSYKAVRTKNVKEYVKWMMYWIVFAFFTCLETITDVFLSFWFPFYYEIKILVVLWLLSPATRGSSILYRKFVHPWLTRREEEIDDCIAKAKQQGYSTVVQLGTKGVNYATTVIMQTAIKGGGGLVNQLKRSYSASEIGEDTSDHNSNVKGLPPQEQPVVSIDDDDRSISSGSHDSSEIRIRSESESSSHRMRGHSTGRAVRSTKTRSADVSDVQFLDVSDGVPQRRSTRTHDIMSTSAGVGVNVHNVVRRSRTGDISSYATLPRAASKRVGTIKKKQI